MAAARDSTPARIFDLTIAFFGSKALMSAVELDLFTLLARAPLDAGGIRARLGLHELAHRDFLDALVALRLLERDANGLYRNAEDAAWMKEAGFRETRVEHLVGTDHMVVGIK